MLVVVEDGVEVEVGEAEEVEGVVEVDGAEVVGEDVDSLVLQDFIYISYICIFIYYPWG